MPLIKRPDCEKMISPRVEMCPFCGCPAEFFESEKVPKGVEKKSETQVETHEKSVKTFIDKRDNIVFCFGGQSFEYSKKEQEYIRGIAYYLVMANSLNMW